jgi:hypothetical protein
MLLLTSIFAFAALVLGAMTASSRSSADPLRAVWIRGGKVHATFALPRGMTPYALRFANAKVPLKRSQWFSTSVDGEVVYILPSLPRGDQHNQNPGITTSHSWVSVSPWVRKLLQAMQAYGLKLAVYLFYAPKETCIGVDHCKGIRVSLPRPIKAPGFAPGPLVGRSTASGEYAATSVSGSARAPYAHSFPIRVASSPNRQRVHIDWDITCTKGLSAKGLSGGRDVTTPVEDVSYIILVPFIRPDRCVVSVGASLLDGGGTITLAVYASQY